MQLLKKSKKFINDYIEIRSDIKKQFKSSWLKRTSASYYKILKKNLPIKENTILYESYWGRGIIDNPYAIFKYLIKIDKNKKYKHIWALNEKSFNSLDFYKKYINYPNVIFVQTHSIDYHKALATSHFLVNNVTFPYYFVKQEGQIYINTWHGTALKNMGYEIPDGKLASGNVVRNFISADYLISANEVMSNMYLDSYKMNGIMTGEIIEEGYPRNDLLIQIAREDILGKLSFCDVNVQDNKRIILYAPTWRKSINEKELINSGELIKTAREIEKLIDTEKYQILIKPHQFVYEALKGLEEYKGILIPSYIDANEILSIVDVLITDFSSIFLDYMCLKRPIIYYVPDIDAYKKERGINYRIEDLPGRLCTDIKEVAEAIKNIDFNNVETEKNSLSKTICEHEDGKATERIVDIIIRGNIQGYKIIKPVIKKKKMLIFGGVVYINGIFNALLGLLNNIDYEEWDVTLLLILDKKTSSIKRMVEDDINPNVRVIIRPGTLLNTFYGEIKREFINRRGIYRRIWDRLYPYGVTETEFKRLFSNVQFDYIINYEGYNRTYAPVMLGGKAKKRSIWLHSDMKADKNKTVNGVKKNYISLNYIASLYPKYDNIVSCARSVMEVNRENLSTDNTYSKYKYARNFFNKDRFLDKIDNEFVFFRNGNEWLCLNQKKDLNKDFFEIKAVQLPSKEKTNFIAIGRLSTEKNYKALIAAFSRYVKQFPESCLFILGDGPLRGELEKYIDELNVKDKVILTGNVDNPYAFLKRSDCFILPSLHEGQPIVLLEARACHLPIIVSNFSAVNDSLVPDGQLVINMDEESIYNGLCTFMEGKVPVKPFDIDEYNRETYEEFINAIQ